MSPQILDGFPAIVPPGGAAVISEAAALAGPPVRLVLPPGPFAPEEPDNLLLTFVVAEGVEILEAAVSLRGTAHTTNLRARAVITNGRALIDFGGLRPLTRIDFTRGGTGETNRLMIQLGGVWHLPAPAGAVTDFNLYTRDTPFPELITEKVLLGNVASVENVESITFPSNVTLRLTDGGVPFFFQRGNLRAEQVRVPDFGEQLALAARGVEPVGGTSAIDLIAHSDTFGTIFVDRASVASRVTHNSLNGLTFEARTRTIPAGGSVRLDLPLAAGLELPEGRPAVTAVLLDLLAVGFGPTFVPAVVRHGAVVSAEFGVAQPVDIGSPLTMSTLHLYLLRRKAMAALTLELRQDTDGEPRGAVLAAASVDAAGLPDGEFGWLPVTLPAPLVTEAGTRRWIVLRAEAGEVEWGGDNVPSGGLAAQFSADRGNTWQPHPMAAGFLFEQVLPDPDVPLTLRLAAGGQQQAVPYDPSRFPVALDAESPLVRGINAAIEKATGGKPGTPLPAAIGLILSADPPLPVQVSFTRCDVVLAQTQVIASSFQSGSSGGLRPRSPTHPDAAHADFFPTGAKCPNVAGVYPEHPITVQSGR